MCDDNSTVVPVAAISLDDVAELDLHQRVQAAGWFIQDQQRRRLRQRRHQQHLLTVAFGVGAALLRRVEREALNQFVALCRVETTMESSEETEHDALVDVEIEGVEREGASIALRQSRSVDDRSHRIKCPSRDVVAAAPEWCRSWLAARGCRHR